MPLTNEYTRGLLIFEDSNTRYFFILEQSNGFLYLFKTSTQAKPHRILTLSGGSLVSSHRLISDKQTGEIVNSFDFKLCRWKGQRGEVITVFTEEGVDIERLRETFTICSQNPIPKASRSGNVISRGALIVVKAPWKIAQLVIISLEKICDGARATPYVLTGTNKDRKKIERVDVSNLLDGLARGSFSMIKEILGAVAGLVVEPYKGAKRKGAKGGASGFGKGMLGLICKPLAGSLDLVTYTTRGLGNTPKSIYQRIKKTIRKRRLRQIKGRQQAKFQPKISPYIPSQAEIDSKLQAKKVQFNNHSQITAIKEPGYIVIGAQDDKTYLVSKDYLIESINILSQKSVNHELFENLNEYWKLISWISQRHQKYLKSQTFQQKEDKALAQLHNLAKLVRLSLLEINHRSVNVIGLNNIDSEDEGFSSTASHDHQIQHKPSPNFEKMIEECLELINDKLEIKVKSQQAKQRTKIIKNKVNASELKDFLIDEKQKNSDADIYIIEAEEVVEAPSSDFDYDMDSSSDQEEEQFFDCNNEDQNQQDQEQIVFISESIVKFSQVDDERSQLNLIKLALAHYISLKYEQEDPIIEILGNYNRLPQAIEAQIIQDYLLPSQTNQIRLQDTMRNPSQLFNFSSKERVQEDPKIKLREKIIEAAKNFRLIRRDDEYRSNDAHKNGGFALTDQRVISKYRNAGKELIKSVGRQIISGNFNLTKTSFPIKCMSHMSILEVISSLTCTAPTYLNAAAYAPNPVERMKFVMAASIAFLYPTHHWDKPLNPVLGETFQTELPDGSLIYLEQTSHQPPISHLLVDGPDEIYQFSGYSGFSAKAYLNSIVLNVFGQRQVKFQDGSKIVYNNQGDAFNNTFFGVLNHQIQGKIEFRDETNNVYGIYEIGNVKKKQNMIFNYYRTQDYFAGAVFHNDRQICEIKGNYMGYMDFGGIRYWDVRDQQVYMPSPRPIVESIQSDSRNRIDSVSLLSGDVEQAQKNKELMEQLQRHDRAIRETAEKRRAKGGPFLLGDSISKVLTLIQQNIQIYGRIEIVSSKEDSREHIYIILQDSGFKLRFEPSFQKLEMIELYLAPFEGKKKIIFTLKDQPLLQSTMNYLAVTQLMGPTQQARIMSNTALLSYEDGLISFVFAYDEHMFKESSKDLTHNMLTSQANKLVKINLVKEYEQSDLKSRKNIFRTNEASEPVLILFGDHLMDVLRLMGNPSKEYHNGGNLFLNYLDLGMDLMITADYTLKKIILHTNHVNHPHFGFYDRCFFELDLSKNVVKLPVNQSLIADNEEQKQINFDESIQLDDSQNENARKKKKAKKPKNNQKQSSSKKSEEKYLFGLQHQIDPLRQKSVVINTLTKYGIIKDFMKGTNLNDVEQKQEQIFVRNITNEFTTNYHAYRGIIFETMPDYGDMISSVTLFKASE